MIGSPLCYCASELNQYGTTTAEGLTYDQDGNLIEVYLPGDVDRDGDVDQQDFGALLAAWGKCEGQEGYNPNADFNGDGCVNQADLGILLARWGTSNTSLQIRYTWDAENRLVGVEAVFPETAADKKVAFKYDYLGRRVRKQVFDWDPNAEQWETTPSLDRRFVWYNWLMLLELDGDNEIVRKYTWGLDLAGQNGSLNDIESAAGIGGLLALHDPEDDPTPDKNYVFFYDATLDTPPTRQGQASNVGQLIDWENDGTLVAKYEYDPYGGNLSVLGSPAGARSPPGPAHLAPPARSSAACRGQRRTSRARGAA